MTDPYAPHRGFIRPAQSEMRKRTVFAVFVIYAVVFMFCPMLLSLFLPKPVNEEFFLMVSPFATYANFVIFGVTAYVLIKSIRHFHGRGFWSLVGPYRTALWDVRKVAAGVGVILFIVQIVLPFGTWGEVALVRPLALWLALLPVALVFIFVQVMTEELLFRGYLQQQLACLSSNPWVWMIFPSAVFGAWHYWNGNSPPEGLAYAIWAFMLGVACADLTARTGTLGAAIGLHFAVNTVAMMFVSIEGWPLSGMALVLLPYIDPDIISEEIIAAGQLWLIFSTLTSALSVLIIWLAARIAIRR